MIVNIILVASCWFLSLHHCRKKIRGEGDVRADMGKLNIQNWSKMAVDTESWKRIVEQAKTHEEF